MTERGRRAAAVRRLVAGLLLLGLALTTSGCVWLQNEFFVWDAVPTEPCEPQSGSDARW